MEKWRKIDFLKMSALLHRERDPWHFHKAIDRQGRVHLRLVDPRGREWEFKLHKGAFVRPPE